jgi:serine phosphatase RsbU (regulator of sigma subunit)
VSNARSHAQTAAPAEGARLLREPFPAHLPDRVLAEAEALAETSVALYVADLDGHCLWRLAGSDAFPDTLAAEAVGPELPLASLAALRGVVARKLPAATVVPLRVRDRAVGVLVTAAEPAASLADLADEAGLALELAAGYTDVIHTARRRKPLIPAAEIQNSLLPPRIARFDQASVAGGVLPAYDVGGDFFDYAGNADGLWLAVVDAMGKGNRAAILSTLSLAALRSVRRRDGTLEEAAEAMHAALIEVTGGESFVTAVLARWQMATGVLSWICCGHPAPLLVEQDGQVLELAAERTFPLGVDLGPASFPRGEQLLKPGMRLVLYSDGVSERRRDDGELFGLEGIKAAVRDTGMAEADATVRCLQDAVLAAAHRPLRDDATLLVVKAL